MLLAILGHNTVNTLLDALWGIGIIAGIFLVLYLLSNGKWIGGGDVKLGVLLGILVGGPLNSVLLLLLSSVSGSIYALSLVVSSKVGRKSNVPFGPFLILATVIVILFGTSITRWYKNLYF